MVYLRERATLLRTRPAGALMSIKDRHALGMMERRKDFFL